MASRHPKELNASTTTRPSHVSQPQPAPLRQPPQLAHLVQRAVQSPGALSPAEVLQLHRTLGNRAVGRLMQGYRSRQGSGPTASQAGMTVQPKLVVGPVGDRYEQEADRVAQEIVQRLDAEVPHEAGQAVQRQGEDDEAPLQLQPAAIQPQPGEHGMTVSPDLEAAIQQARGGGQPLPETLRGRMEQAFGADFSGVRIHADTSSDLLNHSMQAQAFTTGTDLFFRQGAYAPGSRSGQAVIAHELTHVVQQTQAKGLVTQHIMPPARKHGESADASCVHTHEVVRPGSHQAAMGHSNTGAHRAPEKGRVNILPVIQRLITVGNDAKHFAYWQAQLNLRDKAENWAVKQLDNTSHTNLDALRNAMTAYLAVRENRARYEAEVAAEERAQQAKKADDLAKEKAASPPVVLGNAVQHVWERHTKAGIGALGRVESSYGGVYSHGDKVSVFPESYTLEDVQTIGDTITGAGFNPRGGGEYTKTQWINDINVQVIALDPSGKGEKYFVNTFFPVQKQYEVDWARAEDWAAEERAARERAARGQRATPQSRGQRPPANAKPGRKKS
jgi:Domain of unknown function (DUF4157)